MIVNNRIKGVATVKNNDIQITDDKILQISFNNFLMAKPRIRQQSLEATLLNF